MIRIISEKNKQKFQEILTSTNWNTVYNQQDTTVAYDKFIEIITYSLNEVFQK